MTSFHDAPDKWMEDDKAMEVCSIWKPYTTHYQCIECSLKFGTNQNFCNYFSLSAVQNCHNLYHKKYYGKKLDDNNNNDIDNSS